MSTNQKTNTTRTIVLSCILCIDKVASSREWYPIFQNTNQMYSSTSCGMFHILPSDHPDNYKQRHAEHRITQEVT